MTGKFFRWALLSLQENFVWVLGILLSKMSCSDTLLLEALPFTQGRTGMCLLALKPFVLGGTAMLEPWPE